MIGWSPGVCRCKAVTRPVDKRREVAGWDAVTAPLGGPRRLGGKVLLQRVRNCLGGNLDMGDASGQARIGEIASCVGNEMLADDGGSSWVH